MSGTRWFSLRRRLLFWLLTGMTAGWLGAVGFAYVETRHEMLEVFEKRVRHEGPENIEKRIHKAEKIERRIHQELTDHLLKTMLVSLLFGLPLLGGWIWFATWRGLKPLDQVAEELRRRAPERLDPVMPAAAPREVQPLLEALNALFARVDQAMQNERAFTADAAHELRTPLAAISAQAQVAMRARDAAERDHALGQLAAGAQRARHLVEQLLTLARLDPAADLPMSEVRLDRLAAEVCADHGPAAVEKNIALELDAPQAVTLTGNEAMLRILLRNLLDNAIRYTPAGGKVGVGVTARGRQVELSIADDGPGIPPDQRAQALRRLHRLAGQDIEGCGLGLSIVARIAELHRARLEMGEGLEGRGLGITVTFGA
ncbi:MAG: ATP-binding protein [Pseudomonadota bacterium]